MRMVLKLELCIYEKRPRYHLKTVNLRAGGRLLEKIQDFINFPLLQNLFQVLSLLPKGLAVEPGKH